MNTSTARLSTPWEETPAAGLVITPAATRYGRYTGLWCVTHIESGRQIGESLPLAYARDLADLLYRTGLDWTADRETLTAPTAGRTAAASAISRVWMMARVDGHPAVLARTSVWEARPGVWGMRCCTLDCGDGEPAQLDAEDGEPLRAPSRQDVLDEAGYGDWVRIDHQHWMCPDCAAARRRASEEMQP